MTHLDDLIDRAATLLKQSEHAVALTGAGVSTPSGIPDFRSPKSGLWEQVDAMEVASIQGFKQRPQAFYDWIRPLLKLMSAAQPNAAHLALAQMEAYGPLNCVITQNIDMLHTRAGSKTVYEVHGHFREATCMQCGAVYDTKQILPEFITTGAVPLCPGCNGVLKPNVILFGELLSTNLLRQAQKQALACDLILVAGSSLEVVPAADLPILAKRTGARLIIVNLTETQLDYLADVVIRADVVEALPQLAAAFIPGDL